ncbi:MAG: hypothetical protein H6825_12075 [Planctomycetes bacterium]|nr:hypothetical protein [Planctomycetota bacterium]
MKRMLMTCSVRSATSSSIVGDFLAMLERPARMTWRRLSALPMGRLARLFPRYRAAGRARKVMHGATTSTLFEL